jgi:hypothetical protein
MVLENGAADVTIRSFAMWRLKSVDGVEIVPSNQWSVRARITPQRGENDAFVNQGSIVGVGLDQYYWGAGMHLADHGSTVDAQLAAGRFGDSDASAERSAFYEPWVVQLDVSPNGTQAFRWPVSDPSRVANVSWNNNQSTAAGLPVFWGNWGGRSIFEEVIVATEPMGVGGDFDRNGVLDMSDLLALTDVVDAGSNDPRFNLTGDEVVNLIDRDTWITKIKKTTLGDANLDGRVEFSDFLALSKNYGQPGDWAAGDFDGDRQIQFPDFLILSENYGRGSMATTSVPEPTAGTLFAIAAIAFIPFRRRFRKCR